MRYAHVRYVISLFTNIQKQWNMLKISLLFKKFTNFTGKTTPRSWQKSIYFHFSTTAFATPWWWKLNFFPDCYLLLRPLRRDYVKSNIIPITTTFTTAWSWQKYMFSFQHYVYYTLIMTKNMLFFISVLRSLGPNHEKR